MAAQQNQLEKIKTRSNSSSSLNNLLSDENTSKRSRGVAAEGGISSLDELWAKIDSSLQKRHEETNQRIEAKIESCLDKIAKVEEALATLSDECNTKIQSVTTAVNEVRKDLDAAKEATSERFGRDKRSSELIISSVPYTNNENLKDTFEKISTALGFASTPLVGLQRLSRVPIKTGESPLIVCQFALPLERDIFYRKYLERMDLNLSHIGYRSNNRIFINENLTQQARGIRNEALKLKRSKQVSQVFTREGVVFVKPSVTAAAVPCHSVQSLDHFK